MVVFIFFFFKQKTAYEIKECDWSSDVCSSDLAWTYAARGAFNRSLADFVDGFGPSCGEALIEESGDRKSVV